MERADTGVLGFHSTSHTFSAKGGECAAWREKREGRGEVTQGEVTYPTWWLNEEEPEPVTPAPVFLANSLASRRRPLLLLLS